MFTTQKRYCSKRCGYRARLARAPIKGTRPGHVYFVQAKSGGPVKIGFTDNPAERLYGLQPGNPEPLVFRKLLPGTPKDERDWHWRLRSMRLRGEWFREECLTHVDADEG